MNRVKIVKSTPRERSIVSLYDDSRKANSHILWPIVLYLRAEGQTYMEASELDCTHVGLFASRFSGQGEPIYFVYEIGAPLEGLPDNLWILDRWGVLARLEERGQQ